MIPIGASTEFQDTSQKVLERLQSILNRYNQEHEGDVHVGYIQIHYGPVLPPEDHYREMQFLIERLSSIGKVKIELDPLHVGGIRISVNPYPIPADWDDLNGPRMPEQIWEYGNFDGFENQKRCKKCGYTIHADNWGGHDCHE